MLYWLTDFDNVTKHYSSCDDAHILFNALESKKREKMAAKEEDLSDMPRCNHYLRRCCFVVGFTCQVACHIEIRVFTITFDAEIVVSFSIENFPDKEIMIQSGKFVFCALKTFFLVKFAHLEKPTRQCLKMCNGIFFRHIFLILRG